MLVLEEVLEERGGERDKRKRLPEPRLATDFLGLSGHVTY